VRDARKLRSGQIAARPVLRLVEDSGAVAVLDGGNGLGPVAARRAMLLALDKAAAFGLGAVGVRNGNHFGAAGYYAALALERGMLGLATSNAAAIMAPPGGTTPVVGNNPLAVAAPAGQAPFLLDIALSTVSYGRIRMAAEQGLRIPDDWAMTAAGQPTTDPVAAIAGLLTPFGGHKGFGLAVVVELLSAVLTGAALSWRVGQAQAAGQPEQRGHFCLALDPGRFLTGETFHARMAKLDEGVRGGAAGARLPGSRSYQQASAAPATGIHLGDQLRKELDLLGAATGVGPLQSWIDARENEQHGTI
jgi:LDH2 family malate/lactate/ureidoglycolate dehydrogenase